MQILSGKRVSKLETTPSGKSNRFILSFYLRAEIWKDVKVKQIYILKLLHFSFLIYSNYRLVSSFRPADLITPSGLGQSELLGRYFHCMIAITIYLSCGVFWFLKYFDFFLLLSSVFKKSQSLYLNETDT